MSREGPALRKERRDRQRILTRLLTGAEPEVSGWVPDPAGGHDLRFIRNGLRTELVANNGNDVATDPSISRAAGFDWYGPDTTRTAAATNLNWLMPGTYVYRCVCKKVFWTGGKPTWYSPVWVAGRKIYLVDASSRTVTHIESGASLSWAGTGTSVTRDGYVIGTIDGGWLRNVNRQPLARDCKQMREPSWVRSLDGALIASAYWRPNPSDGEYDDTVVFTVAAELNAPLAILVLTWGLTMPYLAHYDAGGGGGG